ncbi:hypothetical protein [Paenibacillus sp. ISL-20]|uniref:hypothetical protein n=1 Tax=Paenibacillus sp. ISL-20 TaxID=2819163 RepID=UPI001BE96C55|nr:hypothetical protein [Paenibacillus sp. ISL-20]MBT2764810.1 hypothetical protein [Paenibacillus sp. ISL-20]
MDSAISLEFKDENRLIDYLKVSFNMNELRSICRSLNLDTDDHFNKFLSKADNCEYFVEGVRQHGLYNELFSILQTKQFFRDRFKEVFPEFSTVVADLAERNQLRQAVFSTVSQSGGIDIADWLKHTKEDTVLILGKDSPAEYMDNLKEVAQIIQNIGYSTILIKEQPEIGTLSNEEKMLAYAAISKFVIIEKSEPAGQIDEAKICAFNRIPAIWIHRKGTGDTWMQGDYEVDFKFIRSFAYEESEKEVVLNRAVEWVEQFLKEKSEYLDDIYPWRN